uniref:ribonuclease H n=1 Tax=Dicentrarchus labrax TaxID=13489 RepID=A0A8P4FYC4_DICLA
MDPRTEYSETGDVYRTAVTSTVQVKRTVELLENKPRGSSVYTVMTTESMPAELTQVPDCLWAKHKYDVGLMKNATPLVIHPKSDYRPCLKQYPLKQEAIDGITPVFKSLLKAGIIVPCNDSPVRTPIFPVKKIRDEDQPREWRFVQDLQAVNAAVHPRAPEVSNPHTILSLIPPNATHFSVVDLANAFFSVPVHPESQYWFAFTFQGRSYTWTRCAQGYSESPTYFHQQLSLNLQNFEFPSGSVLLAYVDDLMVASPSEEACKTNTIALLTFLANSGHKASLSKLQFVQTKVAYLGHVITAEGKSLSPKRIAAIQNVPRPVTKKHVLSFLGMTSYCRQWIPNYSEREAPLSATVHGKKLTAHGKITWTPEAEKAFADLKCALVNAPTLGLPNPNKPFVQFIDQKGGYATSVLCQKHGDKLRPVAYFSTKLDPVATGLPPCLRAVAAAEKAVIASRDLVGYSELILMVPHAIAHILHTQKTSHLSAQRWLRYHTTLLEMPNVTVKRCSTLNPASLLPTQEDGDDSENFHDCVQILEEECSPRVDLSDTPLPNADLKLFVDGSASRDKTGINQTGFAVVTLHEIVASGKLPSHFSAQAAELVALTKACKHAEGKIVNIYTDSRYAFGVVHDFGALWRHRGFLTSSGKPVANHHLVSDLLGAIMLPAKVSVMKCDAHTNNSDPVSVGNAAADAAAKAAAVKGDMFHILLSSSQPDVNPCADLPTIQQLATAAEKAQWSKAGATFSNKIWFGPDSKPCLPRALFPYYAKLAHGKDHVGKGGMSIAISANWYTRGFSIFASDYCKRCITCATHNAAGAQKVMQPGHPPPQGPFQYWMMDFIELSPCEGKKYCLVLVDMFSKWVEVFPSSKQDAGAVAKALLREIIPRWGIPTKLSSDNGPAFIHQAMKEMSEFLGYDLKHHCSYHPQSGGAVERENGTIKAKLSKCCEETGLTWIKALPLVLFHMRTRIRNKHGLSPFEVVYGRPPNTGLRSGTASLDSKLYDDDMLNYCITLTASLSALHSQVKAVLPTPADTPQHNFKPGDWVVIKDFRRKHWKQRRFQGPFQVLLMTQTAVKVAGKLPWVHASHCKRIPEPYDDFQPPVGTGGK